MPVSEYTEFNKESLNFSKSIKKIIQIPIKKVKDYKEQRMSPRKNLTIEISDCHDECSPCKAKNFENNFLIPRESGELSIEKNYEKKICLNSSCFSSSLSSCSFEDPFYYANMIKVSGFSSFHTILDRKNDMISNPFPYCSRIGKSPKVKKLIKKQNPVNQLSMLADCKCKLKISAKIFNEFHTEESHLALPTLNDIKSIIPSLSRLHFHPQKAICFRNLIIFNFEGALGIFTSVLYVKSGA